MNKINKNSLLRILKLIPCNLKRISQIVKEEINNPNININNNNNKHQLYFRNLSINHRFLVRL